MKKADNFDVTKWLVENKITTQSRLDENEQSIDNIIERDNEFLLTIASEALDFYRKGNLIEFNDKDGNKIRFALPILPGEEKGHKNYENATTIINYKKQLSPSELENFEKKYKKSLEDLNLNKNKNKNNDEDFSDDDDEDFNLSAAFMDSPNKASYNDVLYIFQSYENEGILNDFQSKFPKGKPISKQDYSNFAMDLIDDDSDAVYVKANWVSLFDDDVFEKAGLV
jgi:hypothetical protein